jgi:hypothetical protein
MESEGDASLLPASSKAPRLRDRTKYVRNAGSLKGKVTTVRTRTGRKAHYAAGYPGESIRRSASLVSSLARG